ncbi:MAG TPA: serine/threonine-protein kinase [Sandaracinaceae bacterium LLY-WYZ-13_1]|nr:serine/threonine-protein kinase [Sandaracinaceae bacterium LLY-WYZ-13_1]
MQRDEAAARPTTIGPFRVVRRLGAGGMAEAFEGIRRGPGGFEQRVCIKRVLPAYSTDPDFVRLFQREARLAAALSHRNLTRVLDFGEDAGCHYLALELVEGVDLRRLLEGRPGRRLPVQVTALLGVELAEALEHAHTRGAPTGPVVHRDVSPANVLLSVDGDVKLTDFGISKALGEAPGTRSDFARGNLWYMAPECLHGLSRSDARSDLFSLGVLLYQCLAGRRPYEGASDADAMMALSEGRRTPLRGAAPGLPEPMIMAVERLLAHRPEDRFADAAALAEALAPLTSLAGARRALRRLVRDARGAAESHDVVRVPDVRVGAPPVEDLADTAPDRPAVAPGAALAAAAGASIGAPLDDPPGVRPRWRPYARAPGVWASAERAVAMRRARRDETAPREPAKPGPRPASAEPSAQVPPNTGSAPGRSGAGAASARSSGAAPAFASGSPAPGHPGAAPASAGPSTRASRAARASAPRRDDVPAVPLHGGRALVPWMMALGALGLLGLVLGWLLAGG